MSEGKVRLPSVGYTKEILATGDSIELVEIEP
jgi:hypothetical protein